MTRSGHGCESVVYSTFGMNYSHVCGRVIAYQHSMPDVFLNLASQNLYIQVAPKTCIKQVTGVLSTQTVL